MGRYIPDDKDMPPDVEEDMRWARGDDDRREHRLLLTLAAIGILGGVTAMVVLMMTNSI